MTTGGCLGGKFVCGLLMSASLRRIGSLSKNGSSFPLKNDITSFCALNFTLFLPPLICFAELL